MEIRGSERIFFKKNKRGSQQENSKERGDIHRKEEERKGMTCEKAGVKGEV